MMDRQTPRSGSGPRWKYELQWMSCTLDAGLRKDSTRIAGATYHNKIPEIDNNEIMSNLNNLSVFPFSISKRSYLECQRPDPHGSHRLPPATVAGINFSVRHLRPSAPTPAVAPPRYRRSDYRHFGASAPFPNFSLFSFTRKRVTPSLRSIKPRLLLPPIFFLIEACSLIAPASPWPCRHAERDPPFLASITIVTSNINTSISSS